MENKIISGKEQKKLLLDMLKYIDNICRKNDIKYSLIGGSLIGAIRHQGFIPWDDDIDIVLDYKNYQKLINILKSERNKDYEIFIPGEKKTYPFQFAKLVNKNTKLQEEGIANKINDYGLFVDLFCYINIPDNEVQRKKFFQKMVFINNCLLRVKLNHRNPSFFKKVIRIFKNLVNYIIGNKFFLNQSLNMQKKYSNIKTKYVMTNNPVYGYKKELQLSQNIQEYEDANFEGIKVMIFKNYDEILKTYFNDYMALPPKEKRTNHNLSVYWK